MDATNSLQIQQPASIGPLVTAPPGLPEMFPREEDASNAKTGTYSLHLHLH